MIEMVCFNWPKVFLKQNVSHDRDNLHSIFFLFFVCLNFFDFSEYEDKLLDFVQITVQMEINLIYDLQVETKINYK